VDDLGARTNLDDILWQAYRRAKSGSDNHKIIIIYKYYSLVLSFKNNFRKMKKNKILILFYKLLKERQSEKILL